MEVDEVKYSNNRNNNNNKNSPSMPSNFVTIVQLEERWLQEKQSKLKEKEQEEAEEEKERQRKLQLQKLREQEEEEQKRKRVQSQGRLKYNTNDRKPDRRQQFWRENRQAVVEVSHAKKPEESAALVAVEVGIGNVSAQKEQTGEEAKENSNEKKNKKKTRKKKKKMKPRSEEEKEKEKEKEKEEVEVTGGATHAPKVISEKENSPIRRNGESEGTRSEFRATAEIERKFGDFTIGKGNVRLARRNTGIYHGHRQNRGFGGSYRDYKGSSKFGDRKEVQKPSGAGMVWVRKGEIGGVHNQSSISVPKKSM